MSNPNDTPFDAEKALQDMVNRAVKRAEIGGSGINERFQGALENDAGRMATADRLVANAINADENTKPVVGKHSAKVIAGQIDPPKDSGRSL